MTEVKSSAHKWSTDVKIVRGQYNNNIKSADEILIPNFNSCGNIHRQSIHYSNNAMTGDSQTQPTMDDGRDGLQDT